MLLSQGAQNQISWQQSVVTDGTLTKKGSSTNRIDAFCAKFMKSIGLLYQITTRYLPDLDGFP